ncbi:50S ribosomal protein L25 [Bacteroidota bacterium]
MLEINLDVAKRSRTNKGAINQMRRDGKVPGVFYIKGEEPLTFVVSEKDLKPLVYTAETRIVNLKVDDAEPKRAVLRDIQFDPVTERILHIDLMGLTAGQSLHLQIPILLEGTAKGIKEGGILQHQLHKIEIECLPKHIPRHIGVEVTELGIGDSIHVKDLEVEDIKILTNEDVTVVSVIQPRVVVEEEPALEEEIGEEEQAQPEVIGKGKPEEEEGKE